MKRLLSTLTACCVWLSSVAYAAAPAVSADGAWTHVDENTISARSVTSGAPWVVPAKYAAFTINEPAVRGPAFSAPPEEVTPATRSGTILTVPKPDGNFERFKIVDVTSMEPGLAAKYPDIRTFSGVGIDDPEATLRGDITANGFRGSVRNNSGSYYVDPLFRGNTELHVSYYLTDAGGDGNFTCEVEETSSSVAQSMQALPRTPFGFTLRTYRLAMATTFEYTQVAGVTAALTQATIVSVVNRMNQVFEADVAVRFILVANNDQLISTADPDDYTDNDMDNLLSENGPHINGIIGSGSYDIGHVLNSTGSGKAGGSNVCSASKARGTSSIRGGSPSHLFAVLHTCHEVGHQFGAGHSWSGKTGNCNSGNFESADAVEPGSGSTIMGYPGTCDAVDNLQGGKDPYFNLHSIGDIVTFLESGSASCAVTNPSGNTPPAVSGGPDIYVPINTPFKLNANGTDADSDPVYYCWEQMDISGLLRGLTDPDDGISPFYRSYMPTFNPARYFPTNPFDTTTKGDMGFFTFPNADHKFSVTVRDLRTDGGGTNSDDIIVHTLPDTPDKLKVTVGNTVAPSEVWTGTTHLITWDVNGTDKIPYNIFDVNIMLSVDGGVTFPFMLLANTPNDGSALVNLPNVRSTTAKIRVEPVASGMYDVSDGAIILGGHIVANPALADFGLVCPGEAIDRTIEVFNTGNGDLSVVGLTLAGNPAYTFAPGTVAPSAATPLIIAPGSHVNVTIHLNTPVPAGAASGQMRIESNDPTQPLYSIPLEATVGSPDISVTPVAIDFGTVCAEDMTNREKDVTICNTGTCDLKVTNITVTGADYALASLPGFPVVIKSGSCLSFKARYTATTVGTTSAPGKITISSTDPDRPTVDVSLAGKVGAPKISVAPCPLSFGTVCQEDLAAHQKDVTIYNTGICDLTVTEASVTGSEFAITNLPTLPATVHSGSSLTFKMNFTPTSVGPKTATYTVKSNDPVNPTITCEVSGETVENSITAPDRIPFKPTVVSSIADCTNDQPLPILNSGLCQVQVSAIAISGPNADSFSLVGLPDISSGPISIGPGMQVGDGNLVVRFRPANMITERFHRAELTVTYISDPITMAEKTVTIPLMGEATQTGFRLLVRAGGVPVNNVLEISGTVKGVAAKGKKLTRKLKVKNATLRTVTAPAPFTDDLSFQYQAEFGALTNSGQLPTGEVMLKIKYQIGKKKVTKSVRFQNTDTCTFNQDVIIDF